MYKKVFQFTLLAGCIMGSTNLSAFDEAACKAACWEENMKDAPSADEDYRTRNAYLEIEISCEYGCEDKAKAAPRARMLNTKPKPLHPKANPTPAPTPRK